MDSKTIVHNNNFNFLRLLGACLVIFSHCYDVTGNNNSEPVSMLTGGKLEASAFGLTIFFFISGYFVTKSAFEAENILIFLRKRIFRIYPALIITVLLTVFVVGPLFTDLNTGNYFSAPDTWKYLYTLTGIRIRSDLPGVFASPSFFQKGVNASLWTIALELELYLALAFFLFTGVLKNKKIFAYITLSLVLVCFFCLSLKADMPFFYVRYFNLAGIFFFGSYVYTSSISKQQLILVFIFSIILYSLLYILKWPKIKPDFLVFIIVSCTTYLVGFSKKIKLKISNDISYGLYVLAFPIQQIVFKLSGFNNSIPLQLLLTFCAVVPLAFLSWHFIEKPCIYLNKKITPGIL